MAASRARIAAALGSVYVVWGSTYLAIRFALETLPPFAMAGMRFMLAGLILMTVARLRGAEAPRPIEWRSTAICGALLLAGGNGLVVYGQSRQVPSGITALLIATMPLVMAALAPFFGGTRPRGRAAVGLALGFGGAAILVGPLDLPDGTRLDLIGVLAVLGATVSWSVGSLLSRRMTMPRSALLSTGMQMLAGGALLFLAGTLHGELATVDVAAFSLKSTGAFVYLIVFGSLVGYTAYVWLLQHTSTTLASTYAYVNPLVAILLGWALASEALGPRILVAAAAIIGSVILTTTAERRAAVRTP